MHRTNYFVILVGIAKDYSICVYGALPYNLRKHDIQTQPQKGTVMHPISVCIIAKNEESRIEQCLSSIKPYGFEIVVVDTGSTDKTKEIAGRYADKVLDFVWCDDFSAARNFSLREASNNWIFMIDCDETIKEIDVEELNYFRKHLSDKVGSVSRENLVTENGVLTLNNTDYTERFFNKKLYHYTGLIHEQLTPIKGHEIPALLLHTTLLHTGYDMTEAERQAKYQRNFTLLEKNSWSRIPRIPTSITNWEKPAKFWEITPAPANTMTRAWNLTWIRNLPMYRLWWSPTAMPCCLRIRRRPLWAWKAFTMNLLP